MRDILKLDYSKNRIFGLDLLRASAIVIVLVGHGKFILPKELRFYHNFLKFDGVTIFFVLSGFLIGGILIKILEEESHKKNQLAHFWVRRWLRTLPSYYLILLTLITLEYTFQEVNLKVIKNYFYFSQNLFNKHAPFFPEAWSLSVEEWFYLAIPLFIFILTRFVSPKKTILVSIITTIVIVTLIRYHRYINFSIKSINDWALVFEKQVITRLDSIVIGLLGAFFQHYYGWFWKKYRISFLITGLLIFISTTLVYSYYLIPYNSLYYSVFKFSITSLATLFLLPFLSNYRKTSGIIYKSITYLSLISYSMYLIHLSLIQRWFIEKINWQELIGNYYLSYITPYIIYWFLTITGSLLLFKYYEYPMMKIRESNIIRKIFPTHFENNTLLKTKF